MNIKSCVLSAVVVPVISVLLALTPATLNSQALEPITLMYTIEYPMKHLAFSPYLERVRPIIAAAFALDSKDEEMTYARLRRKRAVVEINGKPWAPRVFWPSFTKHDEETADSCLNRDVTEFEFVKPGTSAETLTYVCNQEIDIMLVKVEPKGPINVVVQTVADFGREVFIKRVVCTNPTRLHGDALASSAQDLVGRTVTWKVSEGDDAASTLVSLLIRFPSDKADLDGRRTIRINGAKRIVLKASDLGLPPSTARRAP